MDTSPTPIDPNTPNAPQTPSHPVAEQNTRLSKIKLGFLYVVIGGLVLSALISVVAILIGEFNSVIQKALFTTFLLVLHGCIALLLVLADKNNQLGKSLIPTTILGVVIANMLTSALGIWDLLPKDMSARLFGVYVLLVGTAFVIAGMLRLRLPHKVTTLLANISAGLMAALALTFIPWILFSDSSFLNDLYYRSIGALAVLTATGLIVTCIVNRIVVAQHPEIAAQQPKPQAYPGSMLAIVITTGVIVALFWFYGLFAFIYAAMNYNSVRNPPTYDTYTQPRDDSYYNDTYNDPYYNDTDYSQPGYNEN